MNVGTKKEAMKAAVLAVVGTIDDCRRGGLPAVASMITLSVDSVGLDGLRLVQGMVQAGLLKWGPGSNTLEPGEHFEAVAEVVRIMTCSPKARA